MRSSSKSHAVPRTGVALALAAALLVGCSPYVQGNGVYHEEPRDLPAFSGVRVQDRVAGFVTVGPAQTVLVSGDENLVRDHLKTAWVDGETLGTTVKTLHVWVDLPEYVFTIPPRVVVTMPSLALVRAEGSSAVQVNRPAGSSAIGAPVHVVLDTAALDATLYPTSGASVMLSGSASAKLHSDGLVIAILGDTSRLDNLAGTGPCHVTTTSTAASATCNAYE